jgi:hypothetical protein
MHRRWRDADSVPVVPGMFPAAASDDAQPQMDADER